MASESRKPWEERLNEAGSRIEEDLRRFVQYVNDELVPEARTKGSEALRIAAAELQKLAERMDNDRRTPPPPSPGDAPKP